MRKVELKEAAIQVFARQGYHATKVSQIVAQAGVAQGTFYLYFPSKQALFGEILEDYLSLVTVALSNWNLAHVDSLDRLRQDLQRLGLEVARVMVDNRELTRIFFKEALAVDPEFDAQINVFYEKVVSVVSRVNEICHRHGLYREMDFTIMAHCVLGMIERVVYQYVVVGAARRDEAERIVMEVIDLVLFGAVPRT
jgi:AcrR family transcriptional regulator